MTRPLNKRATPILEGRYRAALRRGDAETAAAVRAILDRRAARPPKRPPTVTRSRASSPFLNWRQSIDEVCRRRGVSLEQVMTTSQMDHLCEARFEIWWTIRNRFGSSYERIGTRLGGFHHTTVLHGVRVWQQRLDATREAA